MCANVNGSNVRDLILDAGDEDSDLKVLLFENLFSTEETNIYLKSLFGL